MSINLFVITIIALFICIVKLIKKFKWMSILHPGLIFSFIWVLSLPSYLLISEIDDVMAPVYPEYVDELNTFVLITALSFIILSSYKTANFKRKNFKINLNSFEDIYKPIVILSFISVLIFWIALGASFSLGSNRDSYIQAIMENYEGGGQFGPLLALLSIMQVFLVPCAIYMGYVIAQWVFYNVQKIKSVFWMVLPLFSYFVYSAAIGGRNPIFWAFKYYLLGFGIGSGLYLVKKNYRRFVITLFLILFAINIYSTFVASDRAEYGKYELATDKFWKEYPILGNFSGVIEYLSFHYMGYQYRRDDYVDEELTYGTKSFGGILKYQIPFSNVIGLDYKLGDFFGDEYIYNLQDIMYSDRPFSVTTSSTYMLLYDDFGFEGTIIVIFVLVFITQKVFVNFFKRKEKTYISIIPLFLLWAFWSNTIFDSYFSNNFIVITYPFIVIDLIMRARNNRHA